MTASNPPDANIQTKIRESFDRQSLMSTLGARLTHVDPGTVTIESPISAGSLQQQGFAHAGLTFAIGDSAAGYSALSLLRLDQEVLTTEMKIHLLAPATGDRLVARGRVIKPGRRIMVVQSDVYAVSNGQERHVALLTGSMIPVDL
ncbi:MAG: PaaI family thioesterase [Pseudomonadota bacterium]